MIFTMSNQGEQQIPTRPSSFKAILRLLVVLAAIAVAITLVVGAWDDTGAATGEVSMRIFFVGWAVAAVVILAGFPFASFVPRRGQPVPARYCP